MDNHEGHISLWDRLAITGSIYKYEAYCECFGVATYYPADYPANICFACQCGLQLLKL